MCSSRTPACLRAARHAAGVSGSSQRQREMDRPAAEHLAPADRQPKTDKPDKLDSTALQQLDFTGSPLVIGDNVYVAAHGSALMQFEDCYVLCFDKDTGRFNWACYIASSNPRNMMMWDSEQPGGGCGSFTPGIFIRAALCAEQPRALAAVDAYDGTIVWLNIYPRDISGDANRVFHAASRLQPRRRSDAIRFQALEQQSGYRQRRKSVRAAVGWQSRAHLRRWDGCRGAAYSAGDVR